MLWNHSAPEPKNWVSGGGKSGLGCSSPVFLPIIRPKQYRFPVEG
jgi:hypothetical protein